MRQNFLAAVYLIFTNKDGQTLLQRRQGTDLWPNFLALPAGHIDDEENVYETAFRTAKEELDVVITKEDIVDTFVVNRRNKSLQAYFDIYFKVDSYEGEIKINEPEKCSELVWASLDELPADMINYEVEALNNWKKGIYFSTIETDNEDVDVRIGGIYKHFKGDLYIVEDVVYHSETKEKLVFYRALYGNCKHYVRPYDMFMSKVDKEKYPDVDQEYRFELQNIKSVAGFKEPKD